MKGNFGTSSHSVYLGSTLSCWLKDIFGSSCCCLRICMIVTYVWDLDKVGRKNQIKLFDCWFGCCFFIPKLDGKIWKKNKWRSGGIQHQLCVRQCWSFITYSWEKFWKKKIRKRNFQFFNRFYVQQKFVGKKERSLAVEKFRKLHNEKVFQVNLEKSLMKNYNFRFPWYF